MLINIFKKALENNLERISGLLTWMIVTGISLFMMLKIQHHSIQEVVIAGILCCIYIVLWFYVTSDQEKVSDTKRKVGAFALFWVIIAIYFAIPLNFVAIFMVIFSAVLLYFVNIKQAFLISPFLSLPLFLIHTYYWQQDYIIVSAFLFWTFNLFAMVMVNTSIREREARLEAELTSRQLEATQSLLNEAVKQGERVRIARNIHDLLGHHLTALTINLQVASRKTEGDVKASIEQCHQLAKLLLSDVREAVSDIRDKSKLDLASSIQAMLEKLPNLSLDFKMDKNIQIEDIQIADAIVKTVQETITNTLKHAQGSNISIFLGYHEHIANQPKHYQVEIYTDGKMPKTITHGNGLTGIKERLAALKGSANFKLDAGKFKTQLLIPVIAND